MRTSDFKNLILGTTESDAFNYASVNNFSLVVSVRDGKNVEPTKSVDAPVEVSRPKPPFSFKNDFNGDSAQLKGELDVVVNSAVAPVVEKEVIKIKVEKSIVVGFVK